MLTTEHSVLTLLMLLLLLLPLPAPAVEATFCFLCGAPCHRCHVLQLRHFKACTAWKAATHAAAATPAAP
jgi:hypothetical protein